MVTFGDSSIGSPWMHPPLKVHTVFFCFFANQLIAVDNYAPAALPLSERAHPNFPVNAAYRITARVRGSFYADPIPGRSRIAIEVKLFLFEFQIGDFAADRQYLFGDPCALGIAHPAACFFG